MRKGILSFAILFMMAVTPINVFAATYSTEVTNNISVGDINIGLEESGDTDNESVLPGQKINKTIKIKNKANKAWVRAKFEYSDCDEYKGLSDKDVELESNKWKKIGEYFYCLVPIEDGETMDFVKSFNVPSDWDSEKTDKQFTIYTSVEAVQETNFTPDFTKDDPWFGTVIESCVHTTYDITTETGDTPFSVVFENGAEGLVKIGNDFFSNWPSLMPGDTVTDTVKIGNNYSRPMTIFFRTDTIADDDLISKVHLTIKNGDKVLYDGAMNGEITNEVSLGSIKQGEVRELIYTVSIPASLTNEFALAKTSTKWIFYCSHENNRSGSSTSSGNNTTSDTEYGTAEVPTPDPTPNNNTIQVPNVPIISGIVKKIPKLGESNVSQIILEVSAIGLFITGITWKPKKKKERKETEKDA